MIKKSTIDKDALKNTHSKSMIQTNKSGPKT